MSKLPGPEALLVPGNKDGQNIIVKNNNVPEVYQWSTSELQWIKIGEAIDAANSGKQTFQGKEYDYVFGKFIQNSHNKTWIWATDFPKNCLTTIAKILIMRHKNLFGENNLVKNF